MDAATLPRGSRPSARTLDDNIIADSTLAVKGTDRSPRAGASVILSECLFLPLLGSDTASAPDPTRKNLAQWHSSPACPWAQPPAASPRGPTCVREGACAGSPSVAGRHGRGSMTIWPRQRLPNVLARGGPSHLRMLHSSAIQLVQSDQASHQRMLPSSAGRGSREDGSRCPPGDRTWCARWSPSGPCCRGARRQREEAEVRPMRPRRCRRRRSRAGVGRAAGRYTPAGG
jgi:hypothetical protein